MFFTMFHASMFGQLMYGIVLYVCTAELSGVAREKMQPLQELMALCTTQSSFRTLRRSSNSIEENTTALLTVVRSSVTSYVIYVKQPHRFIHNKS